MKGYFVDLIKTIKGRMDGGDSTAIRNGAAGSPAKVATIAAPHELTEAPL
jgi:hypothetical protein